MIKSRLIYVPALPIYMRYQGWYYFWFKRELSKYFEEVLVLSGNGTNDIFSPIPNQGSFSNTEASIDFECKQIKKFLDLELKKDDTLLIGDLSFPGIFSNVLFHKSVDNMYAICHATSINKYDIFASVREKKWPVETGHSKLFKKIFVGSEYHKRKLGWDNVIVTYLPYPPNLLYSPSISKKRDIISVTRPSIQKVTISFEKAVEKEFSPIQRSSFSNWSDYYKYISESRVLLSTAKEETFGYQIVDAILGGIIPIAPNAFSYPELLPKEYLYNNKREMIDIIHLALDGKLKVPKLLCHEQMNNFFKNISKVMIGGLENNAI